MAYGESVNDTGTGAREPVRPFLRRMSMTTPARGLSRPAPNRTQRPARRHRVLAVTAAIALLALTGACAAGSDGETASSSGSAADVAVAPDAPDAAYSDSDGAQDGGGDLSVLADSAVAESSARGDTGGSTRRNVAPAADVAAPGDQRSLIKTGNVALRSDDVPTARFDVGKVLDSHGGEVAEENTQADEDGNAERVRLVLRVPVAEFDAAMTGLQGVADLIDVSTNTEDVSTEVIDNSVRVELQKRSIDRISILLDNAADLRDIVSIERELSRREADLGSLEKRQTFLADQTAMATITLSIEPPREEKKEKEPVEEEKDGFLAGLDGGWTALKDVTTGLLTIGGAVLPFALVLLLIGIPGRLLVRRYLPRTPATAGATPAGPPPPATA
jgi:hypothetical protein